MTTKHLLIRATVPAVPAWLRGFLRRHVSLVDYDHMRWLKNNPFRGTNEETYEGSPARLGIIEEVSQYHKYLIAACRDMKISYKVLDLLADDWVTVFRDCGCDALLVWPSCGDSVWKHTFDYRLRCVEHDLGLILFPSWEECWLTEHKPRLRDWMDAHNISHPRTWVFYRREEAVAFAAAAPLPIVCKTATGGSAKGIQIIRTRRQLLQIIRQSFGAGLYTRGFDPNDRQRGFIYLQEYLDAVEEWRMVRIGDSFFGYRKERGPSGLHSASHKWSWIDPDHELLNLLKHVTDLGGFKSMDVDIFRTTQGQLFVNECQTVFGCSTPSIQMKVNDIEGRYLWTDNRWTFEQGSFSKNHMCNLRVQHLLSCLNMRGDITNA